MTPDPHISVTLWSHTPVHRRHYLPVELETIAILDEHQVLIVMTRPDGMSMGLHLTEEGLDILTRQLAEIKRRFRAHRKESA